MSAPELRWDVIRSIIEVVGKSVSPWSAHVLIACVRLGVFDALAKRPATVDDLARELGCAPRGIERLLIAARAGRLVERDGDLYRNGEHADRVLVTGRPGYVGNWMRLMHHWSRAWMRLEESVRTGRNVEDPRLHLGGDAEYTRDFIRAMHDYAHYRGSDILRHLDLSGTRNLIDVGAGPGTYSILFAQKYPDLGCTLFDLPDVLAVAREYVEAAGLRDRITLQPGDYHRDDLGQGFDVAFLSDMLHQEDDAAGRMILGKALKALRPGGRVVVQGMFLHDDHSGPEWPALQSLLMLLIYPSGRNYSMAEISTWLVECGFETVERVAMSPFNVNGLLVASKPG